MLMNQRHPVDIRCFLVQSAADSDIGADFSVDFALACTTSVPSGDVSFVFGDDDDDNGLNFVSPGNAVVVDEDDSDSLLFFAKTARGSGSRKVIVVNDKISINIMAIVLVLCMWFVQMIYLYNILAFNTFFLLFTYCTENLN